MVFFAIFLSCAAPQNKSVPDSFYDMSQYESDPMSVDELNKAIDLELRKAGCSTSKLTSDKIDMNTKIGCFTVEEILTSL